ncbi:major facilitator superfamily domain-containing protein 4A-like [Babylonia areolata]|uniref:major facilitator superfamily domain-containing protein 4A-like n=1 Tax=Babylonia areolata TaxID=304850 RepID=UPI003FD60BF6
MDGSYFRNDVSKAGRSPPLTSDVTLHRARRQRSAKACRNLSGYLAVTVCARARATVDGERIVRVPSLQAKFGRDIGYSSSAVVCLLEEALPEAAMCELKEIRTNLEYRQKLVETVCLFWVFVLIGFDNGILGPCLPDLQAWVGVSLEEMSYVFFLQGMGALLGNVLGFVLEPRFDRRLLMGFYVLVGSGANILIPLLPSYYYLLFMFLVQGVTKGQADFGAMSLCNVLWLCVSDTISLYNVLWRGGIRHASRVSLHAEERLYHVWPPSPDTDLCLKVSLGSDTIGAMSLCNVLWSHNKALPFQFIVVGAGISTFVSPFLAEPFISDIRLPPHFSSLSSPSSPSLLCPTVHHGNGNESHVLVGPRPINGTSSRDAWNKAYSADIKWPFIIVGAVTLPAALAFFYFYFTKPSWSEGVAGGEEVSFNVESPSSRGGQEEDQKPLLLRPPKTTTTTTATSTFSNNSRSAVAFRVLVILLNLPVFGLLLTFADLLTSVGMAPPLCMTSAEAGHLNTVLWGAAMVGRAVSAAILVCVPMSLQLLLGHSEVLWFGTAGVALFVTPSMPGFIAWSGDFLPITPFFMNLCLCAAGLGEMVLPFVGGLLMAHLGTWYMMLFSLVVMVTMLLLFLVSSYVAVRFRV